MKIEQMIGGNVTNDFLDNLAAQQYQKMHQPPKVDLVAKAWEDYNEKKKLEDNQK